MSEVAVPMEQTRRTRQQADPSECVTMSIVRAGMKLGIGRNAAYEAAHRGEIPTIRVGKRWLVPIAAFEKMLRGE